MRLTPRRRLRWLSLCLPLCLAGCTGSLFQSKAAPPTVYQLSGGAASRVAVTGASADGSPLVATATPATAPPAALTPVIPVDVAVLKPRVSPGLNTERLAILYPDRRLDYFADARWSGPLGDVLQDLTVQVFHAQGKLRTVTEDTSVFGSAYWLEIEVTDFQAEYTAAATAPQAHVHLIARIGNASDRRILGRFEADGRQAAAENRLTAIVDAYARAADAALEQIAADSAATLNQSEMGKN